MKLSRQVSQYEANILFELLLKPDTCRQAAVEAFFSQHQLAEEGLDDEQGDAAGREHASPGIEDGPLHWVVHHTGLARGQRFFLPPNGG